MPSPGRHVLRFVAMVNTFLLCVSVATTCKALNVNYEVAQFMSETSEDPRKMMIDDMLQQNWSTLHSQSRNPTFWYSAKAGRDKRE
jgi:hypothetical protein